MSAFEYLEFRDEVGDGRTVRGLALPFHDAAQTAAGIPEIVEPGALDTPVIVELRDGHFGPVVGTAEIRESHRGYELDGTLSALDSDRFSGRHLSIGFAATNAPVIDGVRRLRKLSLDHVAFTHPSSRGAYSKARVLEVREHVQEGQIMEPTNTVPSSVGTPPPTPPAPPAPEIRQVVAPPPTAALPADPVTPAPSTDMIELRDQVAELTRMQAAQLTITEPALELRAVRNVKTAGEWLFHAHRVLAPDTYDAHETSKALEVLGLTETEIRQAVSTSADGPVPQPLLGPIEDLIRSGRPFANALGSFPLPPAGMTIERPKVDQGTAGEWEDTEGSDGGTQQFVTVPIISRIKTWKSVQGASLQAALRTSPSVVDAMLRDQAAAAAADLDEAVINGAGPLNTPGGSLAGITNNTDIVDVPYGVGDFDLPTYWLAWTAAYTAVVSALNTPPAFTAMHPTLWGAILGLLDQSDRPVLAIDGRPTQNTVGGGGFAPGAPLTGPVAVGSIQMVPVIIDANIAIDEQLVMGPGTFELYEGPALTEQWRNPANFVTEFGRAMLASLLPLRADGVAHITGISTTPPAAAAAKAAQKRIGKSPKQSAE